MVVVIQLLAFVCIVDEDSVLDCVERRGKDIGMRVIVDVVAVVTVIVVSRAAAIFGSLQAAIGLTIDIIDMPSE